MEKLSPKEIKLVQNSWKLITPVSQKMGEDFYNRLFSLKPELIPLFKTQPKDQAMKLMFMLSYLVMRLENLEELQSEIHKLAVRHQNYGAKTEYYKPVGEVLIATLKHHIGDDWSEATEQAWIKTYDLIAGLMTGGEQQ